MRASASIRIAASGALMALVFAACSRADATAPAPTSGTVQFVLVAPLCSSVIQAQFLIDGTPVGTDTFRVNLSNAHTVSRGFETTPGTHTLSAQSPGGLVPAGYLWPTTIVTVSAGQTVADSLQVYCS